MLALEGPGCHHHSPRRHPELGFHFGGIYEPGGTCGHHLGLLEAKRPTFLRQSSAFRAQRHPRGHDVTLGGVSRYKLIFIMSKLNFIVNWPGRPYFSPKIN
jgi:hypothetical protein